MLKAIVPEDDFMALLKKACRLNKDVYRLVFAQNGEVWIYTYHIDGDWLMPEFIGKMKATCNTDGGIWLAADILYAMLRNANESGDITLKAVQNGSLMAKQGNSEFHTIALGPEHLKNEDLVEEPEG